MKRTLDDIKRHGELLGRVVDYFDEQMAGLETAERRHLTRELTIAGLAKIGATEGALAFDDAINEAADRAIQLCQSVVDDGKPITNGEINSRLIKPQRGKND